MLPDTAGCHFVPVLPTGQNRLILSPWTACRAGHPAHVGTATDRMAYAGLTWHREVPHGDCDGGQHDGRRTPRSRRPFPGLIFAALRRPPAAHRPARPLRAST